MDRPLLLHPLLHLLVPDVLVFGYDKVVVAVIGRIADAVSLWKQNLSIDYYRPSRREYAIRARPTILVCSV